MNSDRYSLVGRFAALFAGNTAHRGTERGGSEPLAPDYEAHLKGVTPQGVYPLVWHPAEGSIKSPIGNIPRLGGEWLVKWGCLDLDVRAPGKSRFDFETTYDAWNAGLEVERVLDIAFGIASYPEITRSGGVHLWVFTDEWVPAHLMRRALIVGCNVAEVPTTEVNPKSEGSDDPEFLGNYVRLPYVGAFGLHVERPILSTKRAPLILSEFLTLADQRLATAVDLEFAAALWTPPAQECVVNRNTDLIPEVDDSILQQMSPLTRKIFEEGPYEGGDRSRALFKLAAKAAEDGMTYEEVFAVVEQADIAWGKFSTRRNGRQELEKLVERAYT